MFATFFGLFQAEPLKLRCQYIEPGFARCDLAAQCLAAVVETYDLIGFVMMLALGPIAFESVVGVDPSKLGKRFLRCASRLCSLSCGLFLCGDLCMQIGFDSLGLDKSAF